jgi:predicted transcriptional regulator
MLTQTIGNVFENGKKRSNIEICFDILITARKDVKKSHIVYKTNLNFKVLKKYLALLRRSGLIKGPTKNNLFKTTEKGSRFLNNYRELRGFFPSEFEI